MRLSYWDESKRQYLKMLTWVQNPTKDACQTSACHPTNMHACMYICASVQVEILME